MLLILLAVYAYLLIINAGAYCAVGWDKRQMKRGGRRIKEAHLVAIAAAGGHIGAKLAQRVYRHKTRRRPVVLALKLAPLGHAAFAVLAFVSLAPIAS